MSILKGELQCPIDSETYVNIRQKINTKGLLTKETIWAILYQMTSVFDVAERDSKNILASINLDYFYLPCNIDSAELFFSSEIFKESQFYQSQFSILKNLFLQIGINPKDVNSLKSFESCYNYFLTKLKIQIGQERVILEKIFGFKILDVPFSSQYTKIFEIEKPFYVNSDPVIVKWVKQESGNQNFTEIENILQMKKQLFEMNKSHRLNNISQILSFTVINSQEFIMIQEKYWKTLSDFTTQYFTNLTVTDKMKICLSLTHALEAIHQTGIIHRDIKPDNIMAKKINQFSNDKNLNLENLEWLLIDYDKSTQKKTTEDDQYLGTQDYRPPELVENNQFNEAYDIWQLGMCFLYLMMGKKLQKYAKRSRPYPQNDYNTNLQEGYNQLLDQQNQKMHSPTMENLIKKMTSYNPKDRPNLLYVKELLHKKLID